MKTARDSAAQRIPTRRVCGVGGCSESVPAPAPVTWDVHEVPTSEHWKRYLRADTRTVLTCSAACRAKGGFAERKGAV